MSVHSYKPRWRRCIETVGTQETPCITSVLSVWMRVHAYTCVHASISLYRDILVRHSLQNDVHVIKLPFMHNAPISADTSCALFLFLSLFISLLRPLSCLIPFSHSQAQSSPIARKQGSGVPGDKAAEVLASAAAEILYQISAAESKRAMGR